MKLDTVFVFDKEKRDDRCFFKMEDISEVSATQNFWQTWWKRMSISNWFFYLKNLKHFFQLQQ